MPTTPISGMLHRFRRSPTLVVTVVFVAMMLDLVTLTTLEPILPSILYDLHVRSVNSSNIAHPAVTSLPCHQVTSRPRSLDELPRSSVQSLRSSKKHEDTLISWSALLMEPKPDSRSSHRSRSTEVDLDVLPEVGIEDMTRDVGLILAVKPGTEVVVNIFVGFLVDKFGSNTPMVIGCLCNIGATFAFAYVDDFWLLVGARIMQAVGSSLSVVAGLALLACTFKNENERTWANGIAFGGLSVGLIIGFPLGSTLYEFLGRPGPFLILAGLMGIDAVLRLVIVSPPGDEMQKEKKAKSSPFGRWLSLLFDPYIALTLGSNIVLHVALGMVITTEAAWMIGALGARPWNVGVVLVIGAMLQFGAQFLTGMYSVRIGRYLFCWFGLLSCGASLMLFPLCTSYWCVIGPECVGRIGLGIMLTTVSPLLAYICDIRHDRDYGAIYGLYAASYNMGLVIGPTTGGVLVHVFGFNWMYRGMGVILCVYSFCFLFFRKLEKSRDTLLVDLPSEEKKKLLSGEKPAYGTNDGVKEAEHA